MNSKRKCSCCQAYKDESFFAFKNRKLGRLQTRCKQCQSKYHKQHYESNKEIYCERARANNPRYKQRNQQFINQYKAKKGCKFCQENTPVCLDFHHVDPNIKDWNISVMSRSASSIATIKKEIDKCIVICSNCHRKLHAGIMKE
jgi:hypothetical protein